VGIEEGSPENSPLIHVRVEILLCPVQRHKLLVILQLSRRPKVGELVDDGAVVPDELHDVAGLEVPVHQVVVPQVVHPRRQVRQHCKQHKQAVNRGEKEWW